MSSICDYYKWLLLQSRFNLPDIQPQTPCQLGLTKNEADTKRKVKVLQHKQRSSNLTKKQKYAYLVKNPIGSSKQLSKLSLFQTIQLNAGLGASNQTSFLCPTI
jgi:hypothetical protein